MEAILREITSGLPDAEQLARVIVRLTFAATLGAVVGIQRERAGKPAGVRTHMLVAMGSTLFVIAALDFGMTTSDMSRVIQGVAAGIGFIGGGAILKMREEREIEGITTAAGIWLTAAVGVAIGLGRWGSALIGIVLALIILSIVGQIGKRIGNSQESGMAPDTETEAE